MISDAEKLAFAEEILSTRKTCDNCWHSRTGPCTMYSVACATQVETATLPVWWMSHEEGESIQL